MLGDRIVRMLFLVASGLNLGGILNALWYNVPIREAAVGAAALGVSLFMIVRFHEDAEAPHDARAARPTGEG